MEKLRRLLDAIEDALSRFFERLCETVAAFLGKIGVDLYDMELRRDLGVVCLAPPDSKDVRAFNRALERFAKSNPVSVEETLDIYVRHMQQGYPPARNCSELFGVVLEELANPTRTVAEDVLELAC